MSDYRKLMAFGLVLALAAGCGKKAEPGAVSGDAASKTEVQALEKRVAALEGKLAAAPSTPTAAAPSADVAAKLAALEAKVNKLSAGGAVAAGGDAPVIGVANDKGKNVWSCPKVDKGPTMDGKLDDEAWKKARQVTLAGERRLANETTVALCHDGENLYIATVAMENQMDKIRITAKNRDDQVWRDDCIEYYIDVEMDRTDCVKFVVNPDGVFMDFLRDTQGDAGDVTWNATVKAAKLADRWILEISIPLKDMGVKYKPGSEIGFNAYRMCTTSKEDSTWWGECNKIDSIGKVVLE